MRKNLLTMDVILAKEIIYMLKNEGYHPGDRLPSERFLAEHFHVQRPTIRNALAQLVREHYLFSQERLGYFVAPDRIKISTHTCTDNFDPGERCPNIRWQPYSFEEILVDKRLSGKMLIPEQTPVYKILFIYYENDTPLCLDYSYTPIDIYPGLTAEILGSRPILNVLQTDLQIPILKSNQRVTLIYTNEEESSLLQTAPGSPMMKYKGLVYDETGRLIHFFEDIMKIDDFAFIRDVEMEETWSN